jgi:undecaprenyl-diphosphatase
VELWQAALLGLVQGLTEFFPVSSDGHLVALERWLGAREVGSGASFEAFLHFGTLVACVIAFRRELPPLFALCSSAAGWRRLARPAHDDELGQDGRFVLLGTLATVATALPSKAALEALYDVKSVVALCLVLTGLLLLWSRYLLSIPTRTPTWWQAVVVGVCQTAAILPGLSRSCTTVLVGLLVGVGATNVARRSFLLSMPIVLGAIASSLVDHPPPSAMVAPLLLGNAVALLVGLVAVRAMLAWVPRGRMHWFAPWCFAVAAAVWWGT